MKKVIALFSIAALALAITPVLANSWTSTDSDDFIVNQQQHRKLKFEVEHKASASINNYLEINSNSGGNFVAASGDIEGGKITSGDADVESTEYSDVNSLDITDECCDLGDDSSANTGLSTGDDDFILNQEDTLDDEWEVETESHVEDSTYTEVNANTGGNFAAAGEDVEEDFEGVESGDSDVTFDRTLYRNFVKIQRLKK